MKILALGGCGDIGRHAVRTLIENEYCSHVVIADINEENARQYASRFGSKASWTRVDISNSHQLKKAFSGVDVIMNTVGPYFRYGLHALRSAIETKRHYMDVCDDWEPTLEMLALDATAREAGVTAIIGLGASPGISNMLAVKAISELDLAQELYTGWDLEEAVPEQIGPQPSAATIHGIHQLTGRIRVLEKGHFVESKPLQRIMLTYPGIPGTSPSWSIGHPEPITFPRYYPSLEKSLNVMTAKRSTIAFIKFLAPLVNTGWLSVQKAGWLAEHTMHKTGHPTTTGPALDVLVDKLHSGLTFLPPLFSLALGKKDGMTAACGCMILSAPQGGMGPVTGVPLAIGISLLANQKLRGPGVFAPEGAVNPDDFFAALGPLCSPPIRSIAELVFITRTWERNSAPRIRRAHSAGS